MAKFWLGMQIGVAAMVAVFATPVYALSDELAVQLLERLEQLEQENKRLRGQVEILQNRLAKFAASTDANHPDTVDNTLTANLPEGLSYRVDPLTTENDGASITAVFGEVDEEASNNTQQSVSREESTIPATGGVSEIVADIPASSQAAVESLGGSASYYYYDNSKEAASDESSEADELVIKQISASIPPQRAISIETDPVKIKARYNEAYRLLVKDAEAAIPELQSFAKDNEGHELAVNAEYWLGEAYYRNEQYAAARDAFKSMLKRHKDSPKAPSAALKLAYAFLALGDSFSAKRTLEDTLRYYPDSNAATLAAERLGAMGE